jgi:hypothetical protein
MRLARRSGLISQTDCPKASISALRNALLLPEPLGPATMRKKGRSGSWWWDKISQAGDSLVVFTCLTNIPAKDGTKFDAEPFAMRIQTSNRRSLTVIGAHDARADRASSL